MYHITPHPSALKLWTGKFGGNQAKGVVVKGIGGEDHTSFESTE